MRVYQWPWSAVLPALIPNSPGFLTTPQELLVWSARHAGATYVRAHPTLQVMRRSRDVGKAINHEACSLGRTRGIPKQSSNKKSVGETPLSEVSKASVLHMGMHPPSGDSLSYAGSEGGAPGRRGGVLDSRVRSRAAGPLSTACPPGCPGNSRLRARPYPFRWCLTGSFCRVLSCRLLRSSCRRTAANIAPPARSQVSLIADAPHLFKSTGIWASERLGDRTMPPEVMGTLDTGCTKKSPPQRKYLLCGTVCRCLAMWIAPHVLKGMRLALTNRRGDHRLPPELMGRLGRRHSKYSEHGMEARCLTVRAMLPSHAALCIRRAWQAAPLFAG